MMKDSERCIIDRLDPLRLAEPPLLDLSLSCVKHLNPLVATQQVRQVALVAFHLSHCLSQAGYINH